MIAVRYGTVSFICWDFYYSLLNIVAYISNSIPSLNFPLDNITHSSVNFNGGLA